MISRYIKLIIFLVITIGLVLLISNKKKGTALAVWYNQSWSFRQTVSISNSGGTLTNSDILITLDTSTLIAAGKMLSTCNDLRLIDSTQTTDVPYWVESGCNTTTTQIWARVPSIPTGSSTIYIFYGNSSAPNAEQAWTGTFTMLNNASCPADWTRESSMDSNFPYGAATKGSTGGFSSHAQPSDSVNSSTVTGYFRGDGSSGVGEHYHTETVVFTAKEVLPPYLDMVYCNKSKLDISTNFISLFDTTAPSGWTRFTGLDSKFPRGSITYGGVGGVSSHSHVIPSGTTSGYVGNGNAGGYSAPVSLPNVHTHSYNATNTNSVTNTPPYYTMVYASKDTIGVGISSMIVMASAIPPLGWARFSILDSKFVMGSATVGTTGGATTHTHTFSITTLGANLTANMHYVSWPVNYQVIQHTHTLSGSTIGSNLPPYYSMIYIKRNSPVPTTSVGSEASHPTIPTLIAPVNGSTNIATNTLFKLSSTDGNSHALQYKIEIATNSSFTGTTIAYNQTISNVGWSGQDVGTSAFSSGLTANYKVFVDLAPNTLYYWRGYAIDPTDTNTWSNASATYSFTTAPPSTPIELWCEGQINPTNVLDLTPEFSAVQNDTEGDAANYYKIQVSTVLNFGTTLWDSGKTSMTNTANGTRSPEISYSGPALTYNGATYYWRIKFTDVTGSDSLWPTANTFKINAPPTIPTNLEPQGKIYNVTPIYKLFTTDADSDYLQYKIEVGTNSNFTGTTLTYDQTVFNVGWSGQNVGTSAYSSGTTATYISQGPLSVSTTYYWRAYAKDPSGSNLWGATTSTPMSFTTPPNPLANEGCVAMENNNDSSLAIRWADIATDEVGYEVRRSVDGSAFSAIGSALAADTTSYLDSTVSNGHTYSYQIAPYYAGPSYGKWCTTTTLNLTRGGFKMEGIKFQ